MWKSIGWYLLGVIITKFFLVNLIIFEIILSWLFEFPTCSIVALDKTRSDLYSSISAIENSSIIDFVSDLAKKEELIVWSEIDLKLMAYFLK